jgi:hypothetical protein
MRCTQPFIPIARGRLAKQILEFRSLGLANDDLCKHIADKYSLTKLGKFKFSELTLLQRVSSDWSVFNTTQIFKNQIIYKSPGLTQLNLNLNILLFFDTVVQRLLFVESKLQNLPSNKFTVSTNSVISLMRTSLSQVYELAKVFSIAHRQKTTSQTHLPRDVFNNRVVQRFVPDSSKSQTPHSGGLTLSPSSTILITKTKIQTKLVSQTETITNQTHPHRNIFLNSIEQTILFRESQPQLQNSQAGRFIFWPSSAISITKIFLSRLNQLLQIRPRQKGKPVLLFTSKADAVDVKIPAPFVPENITNQVHLHKDVFWNSINSIVKKFVPVQDKLQDSISSGLTFSQNRTILITRTSLSQSYQLVNIGARQKGQISQLNLPFQVKSDVVSDVVNFETPVSFSLQQSENIISQTENLQLVQKSNFEPEISQEKIPVLLTENKKPLLIHLANMNQITSTVESTSNFIQRLQNTETQSILQYRKVANNSPNFQDELIAPNHIRRRRLSKLDSSYENLLLQKRVDNTAVKNQPKQKSYLDVAAMEFVQPQATIPPMQTNQENKVEVKNDLANRKQNDLNMPIIDVNRLADQIYQVIERKIKIERQRRGML